MKVDRQDLLYQLQSVEPGLSPKELIEQSSCFGFKDNMVYTFNGEIACRHEVDLDLTGAVQARSLLSVLDKLPEDSLSVDVSDKEVVFKGKNRRLGMHLEPELLMPIDDLEQPKSWKKLPSDFIEAVRLVQQCAGRDESQFWPTCVHVHPEWVEACDNEQMARYELETGADREFLVRKESLKHILELGMTRYCLTDSWVHFTNKKKKNEPGLVMSCRAWEHEYPDLAVGLGSSGDHMVLPMELAAAVEKAEVFSAEDDANNMIRVRLESGRIQLKGEGVTGWFEERRKVKYDGGEMAFQIAPKLFQQLLERGTDCEINDKFFIINGGHFRYVTCLQITE